MSHAPAHTAQIDWQRGDAAFTDRRYPRAHRWSFDGGAVVPASSSPHVVRVPFSDPAGVDPEEAFVAALASCHMLWFLDLAAQAGHVVDRYTDEARGFMATRDDGREWVARVELRPRTTFVGPAPDAAALQALHHRAHEACFLANSVRTEVCCVLD
jgi:organic hydroperoxide reductase OsmC/OhrA